MLTSREFAVQLGVDNATTFLGPRADPERLLAAADVYVLPTAYDPAANTTLEAMACGLPVVTSCMNGAAEIVSQGVFGSVVPNPVHPDDVAEAVGDWLNRIKVSRDEVAAMARDAAERHPANLGYSHMREIYECVVAERCATTY